MGSENEKVSKTDENENRRTRLCIKRYPGQQIHIGDEVVVHVDSIHGRLVQLTVEAP